MRFDSRNTASLFAVTVSFSIVDYAASKSKIEYVNESVQAIQSLQSHWYNNNTGLWDAAWWNSGNALTTLADLGKLQPGEGKELGLMQIIQNTFVRAQQASVYTYKTLSRQGMVYTENCVNGQGDCFDEHEGLAKRSFPNFLNTYYDDEGWWALGLIHAYDYAGDSQYLDAAVRIFQDMRTGLGGPCNGGIYWSKDRQYVNAIANELYLSVAAALANRITVDKSHYTEIAEDQWDWFYNSNMINVQNLVNDGLTSDCRNNGGITWSYNQGVVLGGLTELYHATSNEDYLLSAAMIANAAIERLSDANGVLVEADRCEFSSSRCGHDGQQFKGVFIRNLRYLHEAAPSDDYQSFILRNTDSIWNNDRDSSNRLGVAWGGPYFDATGMTQSSALDALVAAVAVA